MDGFLIRDIERRDLDAVKNLHIHCFPVRYGTDFFESLFTDQMLCLVLVEKVSEKIVGVSSAFCKTKYTDFFGIGLSQVKVLYICTFGLHSSIRGKGLGSIMFSQTLERSKTFFGTMDCVLLHVKTLNEGAIGFYEKKGFKLVKMNESHYYIENRYFDALKMILVLTEDGKQLLNRRTSFFIDLCCKCKYLSSKRDPEIVDEIDTDKTK